MHGISAISQRMTEIETMMGLGVRPAAAATGNAVRFDAALDAAIATTGVGPTTDVRSADGVPAALAVYGNGKVPTSALETVGTTGHRMWGPAAQQLEQLMTAAAREGVTIGITDSYRSFDAQVDVAQRKGLYTQGGLAAEPGTSPHGWGIAVDLDLDAQAQAWMRANAGRFGYVEDTPREPWHWVHRG